MKIALDPGHGMGNRRAGVYDPGAVGGGLQEADIALQWALTGKWVLQGAGIPVYLTRDDDRDPTPVGTRDDKAERALCTHFISLHCNAGGGKGTGIETFYRDRQDALFARMVLEALDGATGGRNRGIKTENQTQHSRLAVLDFDGPATLVELGFIDNPVDRVWLTSRDVRVAFWNLVKGKLLNG